MKPEFFAEQFHIVAGAPNGIQKLREMIAQLAVKGKLIPQNPKDEPASVLLKRIRAEKEKLIKEGKIKKAKPLLPIDPDEVPDELAESWAYDRLGNCSTVITKGATPTTYGFQFQSEGIRFVKVENIKGGKILHSTFENFISEEAHEFQSRSQLKAGDILFSIAGTIGETCVVKERDLPANINQALAIISGTSACFSSAFLKLMLDSFIAKAIHDRKRGGAMNNVSLGDLKNLVVLLPPLAEQKRIVTKVDQLIALCDELESRQKKRVEDLITLNRASLNTLASADKDSTQNDWQRISDNFDLFYESPENISELRQAILQLAVHGELDPQDPNDEPASILIKKIRAEKEKLIKEGRIKKQKPLPPINPDEEPFKLPEGWEWVRLGKISANIHYGYTASAIPAVRDVRFLRITDIQDDHVKWDEVPGCQIEEAKFKGFELCCGDILIARTGGTIGKSYLVTDLSVRAVFASYLIRIIPAPKTFPQYIKLFLGSELYWAQLYDKSMGTGQPNVNATALKSLYIPLPPLAEQRRIVAKVNQLMALCDELEARLRQMQSAAETLMNAVVNELTTA